MPPACQHGYYLSVRDKVKSKVWVRRVVFLGKGAVIFQGSPGAKDKWDAKGEWALTQIFWWCHPFHPTLPVYSMDMYWIRVIISNGRKLLGQDVWALRSCSPAVLPMMLTQLRSTCEPLGDQELAYANRAVSLAGAVWSESCSNHTCKAAPQWIPHNQLAALVP